MEFRERPFIFFDGDTFGPGHSWFPIGHPVRKYPIGYFLTGSLLSESPLLPVSQNVRFYFS